MSDPHPNPSEDPEEHIGEEIPDPWEDPNQTDWPNEEVNESGVVSRPTAG